MKHLSRIALVLLASCARTPAAHVDPEIRERLETFNRLASPTPEHDLIEGLAR